MKPGARECLSLLWRYQRSYGQGNVSIRQARIASEVRKPERSVRRWLKQLVTLGLVEIHQSGPGAAEYIVKENGRALAELWPSKPARISITEFEENKKLELAEENQPAILQTVRQNLEGVELGAYFDGRGEKLRSGVSADEGTMQRVATLLRTPENWAVFAQRARQALPRAKTWGLIVEIAREVGQRNRVERRPAQVERGTAIGISHRNGYSR